MANSTTPTTPTPQGSGTEDWANNPILKGILAAAGAYAGNRYGNAQAQNAIPPQLSQLLSMSVDRASAQTPLFNAANSGIYQMLPKFAQTGAPGMASSAPPAPSGGSGGMNPLASAGLGALLGSAASGAGGPFSAIIDALKKLFSHGGSGTVQGDKPYPGGATMNPTQGFPNESFQGWDPNVSDPFGNPYLPSDPGVYYGSGGGAMPTDPSGGTGVGPGMQPFYGYGGGGHPLDDPNDPTRSGNP
jgi:hypothetical protein